MWSNLISQNPSPSISNYLWPCNLLTHFSPKSWWHDVTKSKYCNEILCYFLVHNTTHHLYSIRLWMNIKLNENIPNNHDQKKYFLLVLFGISELTVSIVPLVVKGISKAKEFGCHRDHIRLLIQLSNIKFNFSSTAHMIHLTVIKFEEVWNLSFNYEWCTYMRRQLDHHCACCCPGT